MGVGKSFFLQGLGSKYVSLQKLCDLSCSSSTRLLPCESSTNLHKWVWLCPTKHSFAKIDDRYVWPGACHLPVSTLESNSVVVQRRQWHPTPVLLPGKSQGRRSLVGCSPWGREESDTTERLDLHFSLSRIGEGNGNPLQCSCLENPRDGGAWWAAVSGVAQSRTRLKRLSSSSSSVVVAVQSLSHI